jgi:hypothetical protein
VNWNSLSPGAKRFAKALFVLLLIGFAGTATGFFLQHPRVLDASFAFTWTTLAVGGAALLARRYGVRTALGFLIAPLAATTFLLVIGALRSGPGLPDASLLLPVAMIYFVFSLGVTLAVALPAFLLVHRFGRANAWVAISAGAICGGMMEIAVSNQSRLLFIAVGGLSGLIFWLIVKPGIRADRADGQRVGSAD